MWTLLTTFVVAQIAKSQLAMGAWFTANAVAMTVKGAPFVFGVLAFVVGWLHGDTMSRTALVLLTINEFVVALALAGKLPIPGK